MRAEDTTPQQAGSADPPRSSRYTDLDAGWDCQQRGRFVELMPARGRARRFSWLRPSVLWRSRNDVLARLFDDPTDSRRNLWVTAQLSRGVDPELRIETPVGDSFSFLLIGDPGEGDKSQYAVVPCMLARSTGTAFTIIASDVVYPEGALDGYENKFFRPYQGYPGPIYALPGNHDWYDGLDAFMRIFCGAESPPQPERVPPWRLRAWLRSRLWRMSGPVDEPALQRARALRGRAEQQAVQPAPYWMIDTPSLRIVGIDPGITGELDAVQGEWLRRVSAGPKPKLLITGKPIYRNNTHRPCPIAGGGTVDDLVRDPACGYVAVIGGDIHNYQRYPVRVGGRVIQYLVAGGGGAFMHATHLIPRIDVGGVDEADFRCYPLRGDSLSFYSQLYDRRLRTRGLLAISPTEAAAYVAWRLGAGTSPRLGETVVPVTRRVRLAAWLLHRLPMGGAFRHWFSEFSDWDRPPFFKSFLRLEVTPDQLRIRCFAATGCREHETGPPLEDEVTISLRTGG